ncbi:MAG: YheU family protein [Bdellovibrionales bacterium]
MEDGVVVPLDQISDDALVALIEAYILREGTDYGDKEVELETKVRQVLEQLASGDVVVVYDAKEDSVSLVLKRDLERKSKLKS